MKGAFWILALGAVVSALMAATLTRAAVFSDNAEIEAEGSLGAEDVR